MEPPPGYVVPPPGYGHRGSVLEGDGSHARAETHVYFIIYNHIQIYTCFRTCTWPAGSLVVLPAGHWPWKRRGGKGPTCISDLADQSQSRQMEGPNFAKVLFNLDLELDLVLDTRCQYLEHTQTSCWCPPRLYTSHTPCPNSQARRETSNDPGRTNLSGAA